MPIDDQARDIPKTHKGGAKGRWWVAHGVPESEQEQASTASAQIAADMTGTQDWFNHRSSQDLVMLRGDPNKDLSRHVLCDRSCTC